MNTIQHLSRSEMKEIMAGANPDEPCNLDCGTWDGTHHMVACSYDWNCYIGPDFVNCDVGNVVGCWEIEGYAETQLG